MYTVFGSPTSRAFRVLWALEEMGLPYTRSTASFHSPEIVALNPSGKVPVLQDGDAAITDSTAILTYLADKHGQMTHPAGSIERARQDALTHLVLDELDAVLWTATRYRFTLPEEQRNLEIGKGLKWEYERNLKNLSKRLVGPYLTGETMTIADIICVHCLNWGQGASFPAPDDKVLAYAKQVRDRDAFQRVAAMAKK